MGNGWDLDFSLYRWKTVAARSLDDFVTGRLFFCLSEQDFSRKLDEIQRKKQPAEKSTTFLP
jgi:hypothetical protein